jgi:hypothetical protein
MSAIFSYIRAPSNLYRSSARVAPQGSATTDGVSSVHMSIQFALLPECQSSSDERQVRTMGLSLPKQPPDSA